MEMNENLRCGEGMQYVISSYWESDEGNGVWLMIWTIVFNFFKNKF